MRARGTTVAALALLPLLALVGCSSSTSSSSGSGSNASAAPEAENGWKTPDDVLNAITDAGFTCVLPSSDTVGQVVTSDPNTGDDLGGNSLVRCPDFQIMLASTSVETGFARLVQCQVVPQDIRDGAEWASDIVVGPNFVVLPADLSKGWSAGAGTVEMTKAFGGSTTTFGNFYDIACAGVGSGSAAPSPAASGSTPPSPAAS